jgi:hypothetical protein
VNAAIAMTVVESEFMPLAAAAADLHLTLKHLRRLATKGQFPQLLKVTAKHYLVRRVDFDQWKASRFTKSISTAAAVQAEAPKAVNRRAAPRRRGAK